MCVHVLPQKHLHPQRKLESWINGLVNTWLTVENGIDAPSCENHQGDSLASVTSHVCPSQPCCSENGPVLGVGCASKGQGKTSCDNEPLLISGGLAGRDHLEQVRVSISVAPGPETQDC